MSGLPESAVRQRLLQGMVIPAHPLALTESGKLCSRSQAALSRYYAEAGAGGVAVAVHSTQFEIRQVGLLEPVLRLAVDAVPDALFKGDRWLRIAGVCGPTMQALREAELARSLGYDVALISPTAFQGQPIEDCLRHCAELAEVMPVMGFYLQPAAGGLVLPPSFWRQLCSIPGLVGIKIAPFDRYQTQAVVRAVAESGRSDEVALYTGNDDAIVMDLLSSFPGSEGRRIQLRGGLLGQWAVGTRAAVELWRGIEAQRMSGGPLEPQWLAAAADLTDLNSAVFDAAHGFSGCLAGVLEILHRLELIPGVYGLQQGFGLSPGQKEDIDRVWAAYPQWLDLDFVAARRSAWLENDSGAV